MPKPLTEEELRAEVGADIIKALSDEIWQIEGTPTSTVKLPDGTFRKRALVPGSEFVLQATYFGTRGNMIFQFEPVGAKEFLLEATTKDVDKVFPTFGEQLGDAYKIASESTQFVVSKLLKDHKAADEARVVLEIEAETKRAQNSYKNHPNFGRF